MSLTVVALEARARDPVYGATDVGSYDGAYLRGSVPGSHLGTLANGSLATLARDTMDSLRI